MPKRSADESVAASSSRSVSSTAVVGELNAGNRGTVGRLPLATPAQLQGVAPGGYLLTEPEHLSKFLPSHATRDGKNNLLLNWDLLKLMPPSFYALVFECADKRGTFRAVSESKLALDGYPEASRSGKDVDNQAGFKRREDLRLVLFPNAFRILWAEIDQPLRDAWPAARAVMERGFVLKEHTRGLVDAKLDPLCASFEATAWATELRAALHSRHWPTRPPAPAPAPAPAEPVTLPGPATRSRTSPDMDETGAPADSPCGLLAAIRLAALSVDCNAEPLNVHLRPAPDRAALYRAALQATGHPEITPDRIVRLVDQVDWLDRRTHANHSDCHFCGSVCGGWHEWTDEEPNYYDDIPPDCLCACGSLQSKANFYRADLCASCGADPRKSEPPLCGRCGEPEPKWRDGRYHPELHPYDRDHPELPYDDYQLSTIAMLVSGEVACSACRSRDAPLEYTEKATLWSTRRYR